MKHRVGEGIQHFYLGIVARMGRITAALPRPGGGKPAVPAADPSLDDELAEPGIDAFPDDFSFDDDFFPDDDEPVTPGRGPMGAHPKAPRRDFAFSALFRSKERPSPGPLGKSIFDVRPTSFFGSGRNIGALFLKEQRTPSPLFVSLLLVLLVGAGIVVVLATREPGPPKAGPPVNPVLATGLPPLKLERPLYPPEAPPPAADYLPYRPPRDRWDAEELERRFLPLDEAALEDLHRANEALVERLLQGAP
jgi:hypothetical protein